MLILKISIIAKLTKDLSLNHQKSIVVCNSNDVEVKDSIFYSDSINDLPMFEVCGVPVAVNPDEKLKKIAKERAFKVIYR